MSEAPEFLPHGSLEAVPDVVDVLVRNNTDLTVSNTTTETAIFTYAVPAYMLDGDRGVRCSIDLVIVNNTAGAVDVVFTLSLGVTDMVQWTFPAGNTDDPFPARIVVELMAKNSDAIQEAFVTALFGSTVAGTTVGEGGNIASNGSGAFYGDAAEDGTTALDLVMSIDMASASASMSVTHRRSLVEHL